MNVVKIAYLKLLITMEIYLCIICVLFKVLNSEMLKQSYDSNR